MTTYDTRRWTPLAAAIAMVSGTCSAVPPTTITVTEGGDAGIASTCTLRQAILAANAHSPSGTCVPGPGSDLIEFAPALANATVTLAQGELYATGVITISGSGQTIDAANSSRVLHVYKTTFGASGLTLTRGHSNSNGAALASYSSNLTLSNVTITASVGTGFGGGLFAVDNNTHSVVLDHCVLSGNSAVYGGGLDVLESGVTIRDTQINGNTATTNAGGGIRITSGTTLYAARSTISGNHAHSNAGVSAEGTAATGVGAMLVDSTISGNIAATSGGGIYGTYSELTLVNTTLYGNSATTFAGGLFAKSSGATLINSTAFGNVSSGSIGGIGQVSGSLVLYNTIVANNTGGDCSGTVTAKNTLIATSGSPCGVGNGSNGNITGMSPLLGALADNGGPTKTLALDPSSPAVGAGSVALAYNKTSSGNQPLNYDQRGFGFPRRLGGKVDMGSWQSQGGRLFANGFDPEP